MSTATQINRDLVTFWLGTEEVNLAEQETYFYGQQTPATNGMIPPAQVYSRDVQRMFRVKNYFGVVISEPVGYLASGSVIITDNGGNEKLATWASDYFRRRIAPILDDVITHQGLYGTSFVNLWIDRTGWRAGLKAEEVPMIMGGRRQVFPQYGGEDPEELTGAILFKLTETGLPNEPFTEWRTTITRESVLVESRPFATTIVQGEWRFVREEPNPTGVIPIIPVFNPTPPDGINLTDLQDMLDKHTLNENNAAEYSAFPVMSTTAAKPSQAAPLRVGPGRIFYGGDYTIHAPPSVEPFEMTRAAIMEDMSLVGDSLKLLKQGGANMSGEALAYRQQMFLAKITGKAQRLGSALELALETAARLVSFDREVYGAETKYVEDAPSRGELAEADFSVELKPNVPADLMRTYQQAAIAVNQIGTSRKFALGLIGIENPEEELQRAEEEREREMAWQSPVPGTLESEFQNLPDDDDEPSDDVGA